LSSGLKLAIIRSCSETFSLWTSKLGNPPSFLHAPRIFRAEVERETMETGGPQNERSPEEADGSLRYSDNISITPTTSRYVEPRNYSIAVKVQQHTALRLFNHRNFRLARRRLSNIEIFSNHTIYLSHRVVESNRG
jgi:hypothetical protein